MAAHEEQVKVLMKWRMKAWWEGYDFNDVKAALPRGGDVEQALKNKSQTTEDIKPVADNDEAMVWDDKRLETAQLIWGEGYCGPVGSVYVTSMSKLLGMTSKMSVAVIGASLGGPSRVLAIEFGA